MRKAVVGVAVSALMALALAAGVQQARASAPLRVAPAASRRPGESTVPNKQVVVAPVQVARGEGAADLPQLASVKAIFAKPTVPAKIAVEQANEVVAKLIGPAPSTAKVSREYTLLTLPGASTMKGKKIESYPVYLITYDGVSIPTHGPFHTTGTAAGKVTFAVDANTGEWIWGVAR